jgi:hypothetical protein
MGATRQADAESAFWAVALAASKMFLKLAIGQILSFIYMSPCKTVGQWIVTD